MITVNFHLNGEPQFIVEHVGLDAYEQPHDILKIIEGDKEIVIYGAPGAFDLLSPVHVTRARREDNQPPPTDVTVEADNLPTEDNEVPF